MKVVFDNSFLVFLFDRKAGASVERAAARIDGLIESLSNKKAKIIIPTPALTEVLMAGKFTVQVYIEKLKTFGAFQIRAYDERAAIELAAEYVATKKSNRERAKQAPWNKIKFDRQIVAIAKTQGASAVYSDDAQLRQFARECGMDAYGLAEITYHPSNLSYQEWRAVRTMTPRKISRTKLSNPKLKPPKKKRTAKETKNETTTRPAHTRK